ncbi:MAG TPA: cytochrome c biogenesis protein ResB [Candidatus Hydrogenedentes bacterium]|nr:cytochrome c biogenesis protein ResB [Candidatus Hydrogenedentota bacterium]
MKAIVKKAYLFSASSGVAVTLLFLLLVLVFFGTVEQVNQGLYEVQKKYFESAFVVHWLFGVVPLPLPGAYLLMGLLSINLFLGGIMRAPKQWRRPGLLIAHGGILYMVFAGFVTFHYSTNGYMTLYEQESSDAFESHYEWEFSIAEVDGQKREFVIPASDFSELRRGRARMFYAAELPFEVILHDFMENSSPVADEHGVDGARLTEHPKEKETEQNAPGLYADIRKKDGSILQGIIWAWERSPWVADVDGKQYAIELRHKRWNLPFAITLDKFTRELHPGTQMASNFQSNVTLTENGVSRKILIKMNEPLRHLGYTFFQSSWGPQNAGPNTPLYSQFAVVRNPADQWPLYSTCVITFGLTIHFLQKLIRYLRAENRRRA